jgi:hypothetical protein
VSSAERGAAARSKGQQHDRRGGAVLGAQLVDVIGAIWAVATNPRGAKADELRQLGISPRLGFASTSVTGDVVRPRID